MRWRRLRASLLLMSSMLSALSKEDTIENMLPSAISMLSEDVIKEVGEARAREA